VARALQLFNRDGSPVAFVGEQSLKHACAIWQGVPIDVRSSRGAGEAGAMLVPFPSIGLCVSGDGYNNVKMGHSTVRVPFRAKTLVIHGAGSEVDRCEWRGSHDAISVQIPPDVVGSLTSSQLAVRTRLPFEDDSLAALLMEMVNELQRDCSSGRLYAEGLSLALIGYLNSRYGVSGSSHHSHGRLCQKELSKVVDYVHANLMHDVGVNELAALLSLSGSQFSRLFKATLGVSPYQYLQQKRVERALELLKGPDSISDIAQSVGLTNQSHFTQVFRRITGVTPARARAAMDPRH
jgi:AraC family transcriptional regulator